MMSTRYLTQQEKMFIRIFLGKGIPVRKAQKDEYSTRGLYAVEKFSPGYTDGKFFQVIEQLDVYEIVEEKDELMIYFLGVLTTEPEDEMELFIKRTFHHIKSGTRISSDSELLCDPLPTYFELV